MKGYKTILIVDDEAVVVEVMQEILETLGYQVLVAHSGTEAVELYHSVKERVDLVILDMIMSGMGGEEAFDRLKAIDPWVKILLSSGNNLVGKTKGIMDRGCDGFIQKPFKVQELSRKIEEVLGTGAALAKAS